MSETVSANKQGADQERTTFRSPWLTTAQAADYLSNVSPKTLTVWRSLGKGPRYCIVGERLVRYHRDDLDGFARGSTPKQES